MEVKIENIEKNVVQLEIEVDSAIFEEGMKKSFLKNAKKYNIPGFRKGKAPMKMIERFYGEQTFYEDAINIVCPEAYDKAVEENSLSPVDRPEIDIKQIGEGKTLIFTAKVTLKPEVELGQYKGLEVDKIEAVVAEEDVEKEIKKAADKNSRLITVEDRGVEIGDTLTMDFEGFIDGVAFEGGKGENYSLEIGSGQFIPGFEDQLVGCLVGEEKEVNVSFPEDYGKDELSGKPAVFKTKVNEIKKKEIPVIDDDFAKDVSEFDTLEQYKEDIKKKLLEEAEHKAKHRTEDSIVDKAVEGADVEIPKVMIEKHIDGLVNDFELRLKYQRLELNKYLEMMGMDVKTFRDQLAPKAEKEVKSQLVLEKISKVENITTDEEALSSEIKKMAENYKQSEEEFKKHLREEDIEYIMSNLIITKTVDFLVENAKIL